MTQDPLNWSLVALGFGTVKKNTCPTQPTVLQGTWRANSETGVGGGRSHKAPFEFNRIIIFFPLLTALQSKFRRSMFRSLSGYQPIGNNHLLSDDTVWYSCYSFSTKNIKFPQ